MNFPHYIYGASLVALVTIARPTIVLSYEPTQINDTANNITVRIDINAGSSGQGSGVMIARDGSTYYVLTSNHVLKHSDFQYEIITPDGEKHLVDNNTITKVGDVDLAVVSFNSDRSYKVAQIESSAARIRQGAPMYVNGFPEAGREIKDGPQFTSGIITGINEGHCGGYNLVYDNVTKKGMSGGPILNEQGKLIGIHGLAEQERLDGDEDRDKCQNNSNNDSNDRSTEKREKIDFNLGISIATFLQHVQSIGMEQILDTATSDRPTRPTVVNTTPGTDAGCSGVCN